MNPFIEINDREVGYDYKPLIIAEIGINHEGSLIIAKEMVDAAFSVGVEVIKHQTHIVEDEMSKAAKNTIPGNAKESIYDIMKRCSLKEEEEYELMQYVKSKGMIFISTPFGRKAADRLNSWNIPAFKIGSGECNNYPLLEHISSFKKPIILSTGMNSIESVKKAVDIFRKNKIKYALLHTTNLYPTPNNLVRLGGMTELKDTFNDAVVGLSDHTITNHACFGATALGASILERHFTDSMNRTGPDIICSMDPISCKNLIEGSNILYLQRGGSKGASTEEQVTIDFAFASICSIKPIKEGEYFTEENIWVKRPGKGGILAENYQNVIGKIAKRDIEIDIQIQWDDIK
jgi:N-acetylneuraminate synthase